MLTTNTPALRIFPVTPGPHPKALLAHGGTGSKETLFRFGEALATAGFDCYSVDQAGHGESPQPFSVTNIQLKIRELDRTLGGVDAQSIGQTKGRARNVGHDAYEFDVEPACHSQRKYLLIQGRYELFVEAEQTEELWQKWKGSKIWRLPHGHVSWMFASGITGRVLNWLTPRLEAGRKNNA